MTRLRVSRFRDSQVALRAVPMIATIGMWVHVILLIFVGYSPWSELLAFLLACIVIYLVSLAYEFCVLHRMLVIYPGAVGICIWYERYFGFGKALMPMRWVMLAAGTVLLGWALCEHVRKRKEGVCGK